MQGLTRKNKNVEKERSLCYNDFRFRQGERIYEILSEMQEII